ncbi:MAG: AMP-binding protein [Acidimicrobiales bacterium]|nr:AMP-binding protein [Acidimicrobiales bacterium]
MSGICPSVAPVYRDDPRLAPLIGSGGPFEVEDILLDGVPLRSFVRAPRTIVDCFHMGVGHADRVALVLGEERHTFADVHREARALARELRSSFGVGRGDRVAIAMRNLPEFVTGFWAAALNGAIVVPLNGWWTGPELRYALEDAGAKVVFADAERLERIGAAGVPAGTHVVGVRAPGAELPYADLAAGEGIGDDEIVHLEPDDPVTILYTSGTTGRPKGALGTNRSHMANLWNMAFVNTREAVIAGRPPKAPRQTSVLAAGPMFHIGGVAGIIGGQMGGTKTILLHKWNVDEALRLAKAEEVTSLGGVPTMLRQLLDHPDLAAAGLEIDGIPMGGAAVAPDLPVRANKVLGDAAQVFNGYGLTETTSAVVANVGVEFLARPDSVGRPNLTADVKIVDEEGRELPVGGQVGEICVRSPQVVQGYWNDEAATRASFVDGWFHSGDLGMVDADGFISVVDRLKDVVIRGGENVYCAEVEAVLHEHPAVAEVAVVGMKEAVMGERVCAVIVPRPGASVTLGELRTFAAERIGGFKCPEALVLVDELPKTATEKIAKNELRTALAVSVVETTWEAR